MDFGKSVFQKIPKPLLLHPFLFAILPLVTLAAHNIREVRWEFAFRGIVVLSLLALAALVLGYKIFKDWHRVGFICSFGFLLFFAYGHVYHGLTFPFITKISSELGLIGNHSILILLCLVVMVVVFLITIRLRKVMKTITSFLNVVGLAALIFPIINIARFEWQLNSPVPQASSIQVESALINSEMNQLPDIYYILLDGYGRSDVLEDLYQLDNQDFIHFLEDHKFFVASESQSNYMQTGLSISSSLNLDYLDAIAQAKGIELEDRLQLVKLVRESEVREYVEKLGYTFISISSAYLVTEIDNADNFIPNKQLDFNPLEGLLMETSGLIALQDIAFQFGWEPYFPGYTFHRNQVLFSLETLPSLGSYPSPKFVFSHLVSPHPPFVFGLHGEETSHDHRYTLMDGNAYAGSSQEYIEGYRDQLIFLSDKLKELISQILMNSSQEPIIILQSDHGPGLGLNYQSCEESDLNERFSILNAYYLQGRVDTTLYESISPVNTFRVIFNEFFHENLELLPDRSFCATWEKPFDFMEYFDRP